MKNNWLKAALPHVIAIAALAILAILYCKPALDGKVLSQSDVTQWQAMAKESIDYKKAGHDVPSLWTTSMFGGMPTYQISAETPYKFGSFIPALITLGLPKPINVLFLAAACFYLLCVVLGARPWVAFIGAVAYTYASYSPIIIVTGHDSKMLSMAYLPAVLAGIVLIIRKQYILGAGLTAFALSSLIAANHLQVTYYFFLILGIVGIAYAVYCIREKQIKQLIIGALVLLGAIVIAVGTNMMLLWTTYEYSHASNRGGKSELTPLPSQSAEERSSGGLDKAYAFGWSYGKFETLTLLAPNIYGGSSGAPLGTNSESYKQLTSIGVPAVQAEQMLKRWPLYWGDQAFTSGPVYLGVVICLLAVFGLFIIRSWHKWWMIAIAGLGILLAWGSNFAAFNYFIFDHLPFYNKFRAPSQALILPQLTFALLAVMALNELINGQQSRQELVKKLKWSGIIIGGLLVLLLVVSGSLSYTNLSNDPANPAGDNQFQAQLTQMAQGNSQIVDSMMTALRKDRETLYRNDVLRSIVLAGLAFAGLWFFLKDKLNAKVLTGALIVLVLFDLLQVDRRYLSSEEFMDEAAYSDPFQPTEADKQILQDKDPYYRVFNLTSPNGPFNDAMTSYFHKSVGGYHAAKLQLYVDLIERQLSKNNIQVLNMLNTKYVIQPGPNGQPVAQRNPDALGNAWFVKHIQWVPNADAEMKALDNFNPKDTVVIDQRYKADVKGEPVYDSSASIQLIANNLNTISYSYNAATPQFAVFSEIYYEKGWKAFIDGQPAPYARVNYVLRGMPVPAGKHTIEFRFEPASYYTGIKLAAGSFFIMMALLIGGIIINIIHQRRQKKLAVA